MTVYRTPATLPTPRTFRVTASARRYVRARQWLCGLFQRHQWDRFPHWNPSTLAVCRCGTPNPAHSAVAHVKHDRQWVGVERDAMCPEVVEMTVVRRRDLPDLSAEWRLTIGPPRVRTQTPRRLVPFPFPMRRPDPVTVPNPVETSE